MARPPKTLIPERPESSLHSVTLTPDVVETLHRLSRDASAFVGWPINSSAIVRALVRQVAKQGPPAEDALFVEVEKELKADVKRWKQ
jgi:hypothetical protein